jgi:Hemerythrin HHE cation binding domain
MDATTVIIETHAGVERAFARYDQAEGSHPRQLRALRAIARELAVHAAVEEELIYPALRELTGRHDGAIARHLEQVHLLDMVLVELGGMIPADRRFDVKVGLLAELFRQHAREQELALLPELRRGLELDDRQRLGRELLDRIGQLQGTAA